jgi:hypothetical protein
MSKTGIVGVSCHAERTKAGTVLVRYFASWPDGSGRNTVKSFSVSRYGEAGAKARAIRARRAGVARHLDMLRRKMKRAN